MKGCEIRSCYSSLLHTPLASIYELLYVTVRLYSILLVRSTEVFMIMVGRGWTDILEDTAQSKDYFSQAPLMSSDSKYMHSE